MISARPDSFIDKISVYSARVEMGEMLGVIKEEYADLDIDVVIPIPETSNDIALRIAQAIDKPYRQGFENRYVGRTFIMPGQQQRKKSVRRKLNAIRSEFKGGTFYWLMTRLFVVQHQEQIIEMACILAQAVFMVSAASLEVRFPNVYGIDMPSATELIAHGRDNETICKQIGADALIFQTLPD